MTTSSAPSTPVSINQLILLSYKRAGLLPVEARLNGANMVPRLEHGRQLLDLLMDALATEGFIARTTSFYDLPVLAGESQYTMPDSILDVFEDGMFVPNNNPDTKYTTGELVCKQISMDQWQSLTTKGSQSTRPQLYAAFRSGATAVVRFWPVPTESGTMRLKTVRLLGSNADGSNTPDLHRYWFDALVWMLAHYIAVDSSLPMEKIALLQTTAETKKMACVNYSMENTPQVARVDYWTQWS